MTAVLAELAARRDAIAAGANVAAPEHPLPQGIDDRDEEGCTALHLAAEAVHSAEGALIFRALLAAGADVAAADQDGMSALHYAVDQPHEGPLEACHTDVVTALLEGGAEVDCSGVEGVCPLHIACGKHEHGEKRRSAACVNSCPLPRARSSN